MPRMQTAARPGIGALSFHLRLVAAALLVYGTALIFLQLEAPLKLLRGAMGYAGWVWGGLADVPIAWGGPTDLDAPLRSLYGALSLRQPLLPWIAWGAGWLLLVVAHRTHKDSGADISPDVPETGI